MFLIARPIQPLTVYLPGMLRTTRDRTRQGQYCRVVDFDTRGNLEEKCRDGPRDEPLNCLTMTTIKICYYD